MNEHGTCGAYKVGDLLAGLLEELAPIARRYEPLAEVWEELLPERLRRHCQVAAFSDGCLKLVADGASYLYELELCRSLLLRELQRLCPAAGVRRIEVAMARA